jgi:NADPH-dependent 2,4-dienoyl-CoA reductase/sulfur reductase-like enzyme
VARVFADLHRAHGVRLRTEASVEGLTTDAGKVAGVRLADGTEEAADAVVVGVGVAPNVGLAEAAGLDVDNGVLVDAGLRTSDPAIWAVGDIANAEHPLLGMRVRVEHWANALNQPATVAASILGGGTGDAARFELLPYFFTDQYDLGMEYSGYVPRDGYDRVLFRGDAEVRGTSSPEFVAFWLRENRVLAGMNVNVWDVNEDVQELVKAGYAGRAVNPERLADPDVPLREALT